MSIQFHDPRACRVDGRPRRAPGGRAGGMSIPNLLSAKFEPNPYCEIP